MWQRNERCYMYRLYFWCDTRRKTASGYPIKAVVSWSGNQQMVSTGMYAEQAFVNGDFARQEPNLLAKTKNLAKVREMVSSALLRMEDRKLSAKAVKALVEEAINGKRTKRFLDYVQEFIDTIRVDGTRRTYQTMYNKIEEYDHTVMLENMTVAWLTKFEQWMIDQGYGVNYYGQVERSIRKVFNYCIDNEVTELYPFRRFKCKSGKTAKRNLSAEELRSLRDWPCEEWQKEYRDMFMLQVYMLGIDAVDLFNLPAVKNLKAGSKIEYKRIKIGKKDAGYVCFSLCEEAYNIIIRYRGTKHLVNVLDGRYKDYKDYLHHMNDALKKIGRVKKLQRNKLEYESEFPGLTSKWSRHTWATLAAEAGVTRDIIGLALGHADDSVTSIYIEYEQQKQSDEAHRKVLEEIKKGNDYH